MDLYLHFCCEGIIGKNTLAIKRAPTIEPAISASQSPVLLPVLPGVKVWWYSSSLPIAVPIMDTVSMRLSFLKL